MHGGGAVTSYGPPHVIEHTYVDDDAPGVTSVCTWGVTRTVDGALLTFQHAGAPSRTWSTALRTPLLQRARRVLLVSYIGEALPRALLEAGFEVLVKSGPGPDQWCVGHLDEPALRFEPRTEPFPVDLVHLDVPALLDEYLDVAVELGASTSWVHHGDSPPPEDVSSEWRATTEAAGSPTSTTRCSSTPRGVSPLQAEPAPQHAEADAGGAGRGRGHKGDVERTAGAGQRAPPSGPGSSTLLASFGS